MNAFHTQEKIIPFPPSKWEQRSSQSLDLPKALNIDKVPKKKQ